MTTKKVATTLGIDGFTGHNELPIHTISWTVPKADATVIVFHGFGDHSARYDKFARTLNADGLDVHSYDFQGHGRSGGRWCYIQDFNDLAYDAKTMINAVKDQNPSRPLFLIGHSLGSLVIANVLASKKIAEKVSGAILMSPTIEVAGAPSEPALSALVAASPILSKVPTGTIDAEKVSADPDVVAALIADPFAYHRTIGLRTSLQLVRGGQIARKLARDIKTPALVLYGANDQLSLPSGSKAFYEELKSDDKTLVEFPDASHELFNDPATPEVIATITSWIQEH